MAIITVQELKDFAFGFRFDAEFYQPLFSESRKVIRNSLQLSEMLEDIRYGVQADPLYVPRGIRYIRALNLNAPWIDGEVLQIVPEQVPSDDYLLKRGDLLITRSGANCGDVGIITDKFENATFGSYTIRLRFKRAVNPFAVFAFLLSDIGRRQTLQIRYGSAQPNLSIPYLKHLISIPIIPDALANQIENVIRSSVSLAHSQQVLYQEAESALLERVGWEDLNKRACELYYTEDFETLAERERIDAEHYQPKYRRLCDRLRKVGAKRIGDFSPEPRRGVQPAFRENGEIFVIDSKAVRPQGVEPDKTECTDSKFFNSPFAEKGRVVRGDVLLNSTGRGTLGRASFYDSEAPALADNHVAIIHPDPKTCLSVYLSLFLNSPAGLAQSEMFQTGSSGQLEIYPQHIQQILVYLPQTKTGKVDLAWQEKLADKVLAAARAKAEALAKLEEAKRLVESSIAGDGRKAKI